MSDPSTPIMCKILPPSEPVDSSITLPLIDPPPAVTIVPTGTVGRVSVERKYKD